METDFTIIQDFFLYRLEKKTPLFYIINEKDLHTEKGKELWFYAEYSVNISLLY